MGTEIHPFIEFDRCGSTLKCQYFGLESDIACFNTGEFFLHSLYELFYILAGVREYVNDKKRFSAPFPPRGLPVNCSTTVLRRYCLADTKLLAEHSGPNDLPMFHIDRYPDTEVKKYELVKMIDGGSYYANPYWHTPSWLLLEEIRSALNSNPPIEKVSEFEAILAAMSTLEEEYGRGSTRLVFWFDN